MSKHKGGSHSAQNNNTSNHNHNHHTNKNKQQQAAASTRQVVSQEPEITKLDYAVANYLRSKLPNKEAMFVGIKRVNYFIGSKAVDLLMESKWSKQDDAEAPFKNRHDIVIFLNDLLLKKFYHRARKIVRVDGTKKKFKLDMHDVQTFEDSNQPYVWLYEPTSLKAWLLCFGVIFGVIAICLFPLWPPIIRTWVYYLCIAGLVFLSSILGLAVIRHIIFVTLWALTFGKLQFWILPNLTEDVGFFESFWPLYTIEKGTPEGGDENCSGKDCGDGLENNNHINNNNTNEGGSNTKQVDSSAATSVGDAANASHAHQD